VTAVPRKGRVSEQQARNEAKKKKKKKEKQTIKNFHSIKSSTEPSPTTTKIHTMNAERIITRLMLMLMGFLFRPSKNPIFVVFFVFLFFVFRFFFFFFFLCGEVFGKMSAGPTRTVERALLTLAIVLYTVSSVSLLVAVPAAVPRSAEYARRDRAQASARALDHARRHHVFLRHSDCAAVHPGGHGDADGRSVAANGGGSVTSASRVFVVASCTVNHQRRGEAPRGGESESEAPTRVRGEALGEHFPLSRYVQLLASSVVGDGIAVVVTEHGTGDAGDGGDGGDGGDVSVVSRFRSARAAARGHVATLTPLKGTGNGKGKDGVDKDQQGTAGGFGAGSGAGAGSGRPDVFIAAVRGVAPQHTLGAAVTAVINDARDALGDAVSVPALSSQDTVIHIPCGAVTVPGALRVAARCPRIEARCVCLVFGFVCFGF
jgi:hypothetical protein